MPEVLTEKRKDCGEIILNRPDKLNALTKRMYLDLVEAFKEMEKDDEVRVIILSGAGKSFCAGFDLAQTRLRDPDFLIELYEACKAPRWTIWDLKKPVIAKTHGYCIGAGCHLALICDFTIASEEAQFGEPEIQFGELSQFVLLPWMIGMKKAKELLMLGDLINAKEAERIGLITKAVPPENLNEETEKLAKKLVKMPSFGLRLTKMGINKGYEIQGFRNAMEFDLQIAALSGIFEPEEMKEFNKIMKEKGTKAAFAYRDKMFEDL